MTEHQTFGQALAAFRAERGMTQVATAKAAGISAGYLYLIESGRRTPTVRTVESIVHALRGRMILRVEPREMVE